MDPKSELKAVKAKMTALVASAKAANRDLTEAEVEEAESLTARLYELKAAIERGEANAAVIDRLNSGAGGTEDVNDAFGGSKSGAATEAKSGYLTLSSVKANSAAQVESGKKALVAGGAQVTPITFDPTPEPLARPAADLALVNVLPTITRDNEEYTYVQQTARDSNADVVPVGQLKPTSVFTVANRSGKLQRIAHVSEYVDSYLLADAVELERFLTSEMTAGLWAKLNELAVTTFQGTSGIRTQAFQGNIMDSIFLGASDSEDLGYKPDVLLLSRADYNSIMLAKDTAGSYLYRNPADSRLQGLAPVIVNGLTANTALVVDSSRVNLSLDRKGVLSKWDHLTRMDYNESRVLVETRAAVDVRTPASIVRVSTASA